MVEGENQSSAPQVIVIQLDQFRIFPFQHEIEHTSVVKPYVHHRSVPQEVLPNHSGIQKLHVFVDAQQTVGDLVVHADQFRYWLIGQVVEQDTVEYPALVQDRE